MMQYITQNSVRQVNAAAVFALIKKNVKITRREIESFTGFSWGAVSEITQRLVANGYIVENEKIPDVKNPGRTPLYLEVNGGRNYAAGIDININGINTIIVNFKEECIHKESFGIDYSRIDTMLNSIFAALDALFKYASAHGYNILGVGAAMQGIVNKTNGVSTFFNSYHEWHDVPLVKILEERYAYKFYLEHDPNCVLYAEMRNKQYGDAVLVRIDKGIGMAVIIDGKIFSGEGMLEIGHMTLVPDGLQCTCGNRGCAKAYISQIGMMNQTKAASFDELYDSYKTRDAEAVDIFEKMSLYLGILINNVIKIFNPRTIILCGSMMKYCNVFIESVKTRVSNMSFKGDCPDINVILEENTAFGAALIAIDESIENLNI